MTLIANSITVVREQVIEQNSLEAQAIRLFFDYGDKIIESINSMPKNQVEIEVFVQDGVTFIQGDDYTAAISKAGETFDLTQEIIEAIHKL